jgi:hypothetical protein
VAGERIPLGLRVTRETKQKLDQAAHASGRSQSQEAELRLEQSFNSASALFDALDLAYGRHWTGLLLLLAQVAQLTGTRAVSASQFNYNGCEDWVSDPYAYDQAVRAMTFALEAFRPRGKVVLPVQNYGLPEESWWRLGEGYARQVLADMERGSTKDTDSTIFEAVRRRLAKLMSRVRIPADTPLGQTAKRRKRFW